MTDIAAPRAQIPFFHATPVVSPSGTTRLPLVHFSLTTMLMFYLPANNQVLASYDGYVVFAVWIAIWLWHRSRFPLSVAMKAQRAGSNC